MSRSAQPCWTCKKCVGKCSWSKNFKPIKGWVAKPHKIRRGPMSYRIYVCPEYEFEPYTREMTAAEIADCLNTSKRSVLRYLDKNVISRDMFTKKIEEREKENGEEI